MDSQNNNGIIRNDRNSCTLRERDALNTHELELTLNHYKKARLLEFLATFFAALSISLILIANFKQVREIIMNNWTLVAFIVGSIIVYLVLIFTVFRLQTSMRELVKTLTEYRFPFIICELAIFSSYVLLIPYFFQKIENVDILPGISFALRWPLIIFMFSSLGIALLMPSFDGLVNRRSDIKELFFPKNTTNRILKYCFDHSLALIFLLLSLLILFQAIRILDFDYSDSLFYPYFFGMVSVIISALASIALIIRLDETKSSADDSAISVLYSSELEALYSSVLLKAKKTLDQDEIDANEVIEDIESIEALKSFYYDDFVVYKYLSSLYGIRGDYEIAISRLEQFIEKMERDTEILEYATNISDAYYLIACYKCLQMRSEQSELNGGVVKRIKTEALNALQMSFKYDRENIIFATIERDLDCIKNEISEIR